MNKKFSWDTEEKIIPIKLGSISLQAELTLPENAEGIVIFVHGSASSRYSTRNHYLAHVLRQTGKLGTVLIDLLTSQEEVIDLRSKYCGSNVRFLAQRLIQTTEWLRELPTTRHLKIGYFGDRTGGGAALVAAAERPDIVHTIVSRSGETCLTSSVLSHVQAPTLLIVGEHDLPLIAMNEDALQYISAKYKQLEIISNATNKFTETGAFDEVSRLASCWFNHYLISPQEAELHLCAMHLH